MKKKVSILITITLILNIVLQVFGNISFAVTTNQTEEKKHPESYWSTQNAPMFYGATKITLQKGIIDEFDVLDARFRIFAKDFEDGDLTPYITHSEEVKLDEVGKHEITYTVTDSHKNITTLVVPVIVTEDIATGGYFDFNKGTHEITLEPGYVIEICYPNKFANKVVVYNTLTNTIIPEYKTIDTITRYTVIENGIIREDMSEENAEDVAYTQLKVHLVGIIEAYKQKD